MNKVVELNQEEIAIICGAAKNGNRYFGEEVLNALFQDLCHAVTALNVERTNYCNSDKLYTNFRDDPKCSILEFFHITCKKEPTPSIPNYLSRVTAKE